MSQADFATVIERAQNIIARANSELTTDKPDRFDVTLSDGPREITIRLPEHAKQLSSAPETCLQITASFWRSNAPISQARVNLGDYLRSIEVAGTSPEQVDALTSYLEGELVLHRTWLGGFGARSALYLFLIFAITAAFVFLLIRLGVDEGIMLGLASPAYAGSIVFLLALLLPFDRWLPGAAVVAGDASLLARWTPEVTLVSALLTAFGIVVSIRHTPRRSAPPATNRKRRNKAPPTEEDTQGRATPTAPK